MNASLFQLEGKSALVLVSDLASYVTRHTLSVDGGWMAACLLDIPNIPAAR